MKFSKVLRISKKFQKFAKKILKISLNPRNRKIQKSTTLSKTPKNHKKSQKITKKSQKFKNSKNLRFNCNNDCPGNRNKQHITLAGCTVLRCKKGRILQRCYHLVSFRIIAIKGTILATSTFQ